MPVSWRSLTKINYPLQWRIQDFPLGGAPTHWGGANLQRIHFSAKMYAKTKEMDPVGGAHAGSAPVDPPMPYERPDVTQQATKLTAKTFSETFTIIKCVEVPFFFHKNCQKKIHKMI